MNKIKENNTIICGDCAKVLAGFPAECIDLTITSPPYDNLRDYNGYVFDFEPIAQQLYRVTKPGGVVVWVVGDATVNGSETGTSFRQALGFMEIGFNLHDTMIYRRKSPQFIDIIRYASVFEYMFILSVGNPKTINLQKVKSTGHGGFIVGSKIRGTQKKLNIKVGGGFRIKDNIWDINAHGTNGYTDYIAPLHPAIFPEALARDHIISWSNPGDLILDPMCGSGTTLKMAKELGRNYIGIDISQEYCDLSRRRVEGAKVPLFVLPPEPNEKPEAEQLEISHIIVRPSSETDE